MNKDTHQSRDEALLDWCKLLDPQVLRANLHAIGVYLVAFEILKSTVIEHPRGFFTLGMDDDEDAQDTYKKNVLVLDRSAFRASMLWFKEMGAIDGHDMATADEIRRHRNELAHEIPKFLTSMKSNLDVSLFHKILALISKIDRWWIREIELDCNPDFDHIDHSSIPDEELTSGNMILMHMIMTRVFGDLESANSEYEKFVEKALGRIRSDGKLL